MMISILYFARLRDVFGRAQEQFTLDASQMDSVQYTIADLIAHLRQRGDVWARELDLGADFQIACNQVLASCDQVLHAGDEVAIFPPVTGG